jgi:hypothetical protein
VSSAAPRRLEHLARRSAEACSLLERFRVIASDAVTALERGETGGVGAAIDERDAIIRHLEPIVRELSEARAAVAGMHRLTPEGKRIEALLEPVEQAALRAQVVHARLESAAGDARTRVQRELDLLEQGEAAAGAYAASTAARRRHLDLLR